MGAITGTIAGTTELAGKYKMQVLTATLTEASDTIVVTGMDAIIFAEAHLTAGVDAECAHLQTSWSGTTITIASMVVAGTAATAWTDTTVEVLVIGG